MKKQQLTTTFPEDFLFKLKVEALEKKIPINKLIVEVFEEIEKQKENK